MSTESGGLRAPRPLATRSCSANAEVPLASFRGTRRRPKPKVQPEQKESGPIIPKHQKSSKHPTTIQPSQPVVILRQNALTVRTIHHYP
jgi:hypothetical protein